MWFYLVVGLLALVWAVWWANLTADQRRKILDDGRARRDAKEAYRVAGGAVGSRRRISEAGSHSGGGGLACPRCGGAQFVAKRSVKGKVAVGVLAPKTQVRCVTCGAMFKRG